jgi:hypothetical protein
MLMPSARASAGDATSTRSPFQRISPPSGRHGAVDDLHQRRLAGAVLAEDGVDLARGDAQADAVVGEHRRDTTC